MGLITKTCEFCKTEFLADTREHNRGYAKYCSSSCSGKDCQKNKIKEKYICEYCGMEFTSLGLKPKYCSNICKQRNYRSKGKDLLSMKTITKMFRELSCEICGWAEASCDLHHITPISQEGKNIPTNIIKVCPNHHRMIHSNLISQDYLLKIVQSRTISSSLSTDKEQDAILVIKKT